MAARAGSLSLASSNCTQDGASRQIWYISTVGRWLLYADSARILRPVPRLLMVSCAYSIDSESRVSVGLNRKPPMPIATAVASTLKDTLRSSARSPLRNGRLSSSQLTRARISVLTDSAHTSKVARGTGESQ